MDNSLIRRGFLVGILGAFFFLGFIALMQAMPSKKEQRVYKEISLYSPYKLQKSVGGLQILDKRTGETESNSAKQIHHRLDYLQSEWGKDHLKIEGDQVLILGENKQIIARIFIETEKERSFIKSFYQLENN